MNHVRHPGPASPDRLESHVGAATSLTIALEPGLCLNDAIAHPLLHAGLAGAGVRLHNIRFHPFRYVIPAFSPDDSHAAYYSETFAPEAETEIDVATLTWGHREDGPFLHCHAIWHDESGTLKGGHLLPFEATVSQPGHAEAFGTSAVAMRSEYDPETNFSLFHPKPLQSSASGGDCLVARIRPNQDLVGSIEQLCLRHGITHAVIRSGIGSTIGMTFDDGRVIEERPTELLTLEGRIAPDATGSPAAHLTLAVIDVHGRIHEGTPARARNPMLICFELVIERLRPG